MFFKEIPSSEVVNGRVFSTWSYICAGNRSSRAKQLGFERQSLAVQFNHFFLQIYWHIRFHKRIAKVENRICFAK